MQKTKNVFLLIVFVVSLFASVSVDNNTSQGGDAINDADVLNEEVWVADGTYAGNVTSLSNFYLKQVKFNRSNVRYV